MSTQANTSNKPSSFFRMSETPKDQCNQPAYLFWKLQSKITKLDYRLNRLKRHPKA